MNLRASFGLYLFALLSYLAVVVLNSRYVQRFHVGNVYYNPRQTNARRLLPLAFTPLPLGSIRPTRDSWLEHELKNSATGLAGRLWDFYAFVRDSTWLGGDPERGEYSGLHEGFPYWFNGVVALAYSLHDNFADEQNPKITEAARLKAQVHAAADVALKAQPDGWLGPELLEPGQRLLWGRFPFLLGLKSLVEANATAWEAKVMPPLWKFVRLTHEMLKAGGKGFVRQGSNDPVPTKDYSYGRVRVADFVLVLQWMLERDPDAEEEAILWDCMETAYELSLKWEAWYNEATYIKEDLYRVPTETTGSEPIRSYLHGVNIAQGLKSPATMRRFTHNESLLETSFNAVDWTFRYHGAASGTILGDERIDGLSPYSGSELCTTVEVLFSLIYIYHALGRNEDADRAELAAFNALPSMLTSNHSAHQYVTQPNQPWSKNLSTSPFFDTNTQSQTFGLEPHYPCCTVNHPQGLPKFVAGSWVQYGHTGLAHVLLSPGTIKHRDITIECRTKYPFDETLVYNINARTPFKLFLRIPEWTKRHLVRNENDSTELGRPDPERRLHELDVSAGRSTIVYELEASIRVQQRDNNTVAIYHGALLYALEVKHHAQSNPPKAYNQSEYPESYAPDGFYDWILTNSSSWNIAIDPSSLSFNRRDEGDLADPIWAQSAPPTKITARGCEIEWPLFENVVPGAPPPLKERKCLADPHTVALVPLGSSKLHMAELPIIDLDGEDHSPLF